jgi:hypothetical protein
VSVRTAPRRKTPLPWQLPTADINDADIFAVIAFAEARADEHQQRRAWAFIRTLAGADRMSFWPAPEGDRATCFAEGKRWVADQLRRISRLTPSGIDLRDEPPAMPGANESTTEVTDVS